LIIKNVVVWVILNIMNVLDFDELLDYRQTLNFSADF